MSNEHMEQPTVAQAGAVTEAVVALETAADHAAKIARVIGSLRSELNRCRNLLGSLSEVIGPSSYSYDSRKSHRDHIKERVAAIEELLK